MTDIPDSGHLVILKILLQTIIGHGTQVGIANLLIGIPSNDAALGRGAPRAHPVI